MARKDSAAVGLLLLAIGVVLFASPLTIWWFDREPPWYSAYIISFAYISLVALLIGRQRHDL